MRGRIGFSGDALDKEASARTLLAGVLPSSLVYPLYKKGPNVDGSNDKDVHFTVQLLKIIDRAGGSLILLWLEEIGAYGPGQFAYTKRRGYNDVFAGHTCTWFPLLEGALQWACSAQMSRALSTGLLASD